MSKSSSYQATARKKLGLSPLEETALVSSPKSSTPVGFSRGSESKEITINELLGKLIER